MHTPKGGVADSAGDGPTDTSSCSRSSVSSSADTAPADTPPFRSGASNALRRRFPGASDDHSTAVPTAPRARAERRRGLGQAAGAGAGEARAGRTRGGRRRGRGPRRRAPAAQRAPPTCLRRAERARGREGEEGGRDCLREPALRVASGTSGGAVRSSLEGAPTRRLRMRVRSVSREEISFDVLRGDIREGRRYHVHVPFRAAAAKAQGGAVFSRGKGVGER